MQAAEIAKLLASDAEGVCRYLLPQGARNGNEWRAGSPAGEPGQSLGVHLTGDKAGVWADFAGDGKGDLLDLWRACRGLTLPDAIREACGYLGIYEPSRETNPEARRANRERIESARRARKLEEQQRHAEASKRAAMLWDAAQPATNHPYLAAKGIRAHGVRVDDEGRLVIPMRDATGALSSLQRISADGEKRFLRGGRVEGCYHAIGEPGARIVIGEGYATAASVHEATGDPVVVAFNAGNLKPVAQVLRAKFPAAELVIAGDNDASGVGQQKAHEAASEVGGVVAIPSEGGMDWNDVHSISGPEGVRAGISAALSAATAAGNPGDIGFFGWPNPAPIHAALKPVPALAPELLPDALRGWVFDEAERMPCPPDFVAAAVMVSLGAVIGARCAIKPKSRDDWLIVPNVWGGIVGLPSAKKSPAIGAAMRPIDRLVARAIDEHRKELEAFESDKAVFEARRDATESKLKAAAKDAKKGNLNDIADELRSLKQGAPEEPALRRYKSNDTTIEKLGEILKSNPAGILVMRDELVGLLSSWDREGREGDRAFYLEAWNGNASFDTDRIARGSIFIPNLCVSILGGIQPDKLTAYLEQAAHALANDGMLQRFQVLVYPDATGWEWRDRSPDREARARAFAVFDKLAADGAEAFGASPADTFHKFPFFRFDEAAQEVYIEWTGELHRTRLATEEEPLIQQHLAKYDKLFPALALIFHLVECADSGATGPIGAAAALRAAGWCEYLEAHARRCYGLLADEGLRAAQALADKLRSGKLSDGFTGRDIRRNRWRYLTTDEAVRDALDWLADDGWIRAEEVGGDGPGSGRRTVRYSINPKVGRRS